VPGIGQNAELLNVKVGGTNKLPLYFKKLGIIRVACNRKMLPTPAVEALFINADLIIRSTYLSEK
jgi:hypothetical protein